MHFGPLRGPLGPLNDAYVADDPYDLGEEELQDRILALTETQLHSAASYALCCAQTIDSATEAYESLTMAVSCDPVPCLGYISSGMAAIAWILENAEPEELKQIESDVNNAMSEILTCADHIKAAREIQKEWNFEQWLYGPDEAVFYDPPVNCTEPRWWSLRKSNPNETSQS